MPTWLNAVYGFIVVASGVIVARHSIKEGQEFAAAISVWGSFYWADKMLQNKN